MDKGQIVFFIIIIIAVVWFSFITTILVKANEEHKVYRKFGVKSYVPSIMVIVALVGFLVGFSLYLLFSPDGATITDEGTNYKIEMIDGIL